MKLKGNQLLIFVLVAGFFAGFFYVDKMEVAKNLFAESNWQLLELTKINYKEYLHYIIKVRAGMLLLILFLSNVRWKQIYGYLLEFVLGIAGGSVFAAAINQAGVKGGILCFLYMMPHCIFYGAALWILTIYLVKGKRWNWAKTCGIILFMILGILVEIFVNPGLVKMFV